MNLDEAAKLLREMRDNAPHREKSIHAILFAIKYHDQLEGISRAELSKRAGGTVDTCEVELGYGIQLSKYVTILRD